MNGRWQEWARHRSFAYGVRPDYTDFLLYADFSQRNFRFIGIVGFVSILQSTWENTLLASYFGLFNGGTAGIIYCTIAVWIFMMCMIASMQVPANCEHRWTFTDRRLQGRAGFDGTHSRR
jgi:hypothetical protein